MRPLTTAKFFHLLVLLIHLVLLIVLATRIPDFDKVSRVEGPYFVTLAVVVIGFISCLGGAVGNWTSN